MNDLFRVWDKKFKRFEYGVRLVDFLTTDCSCEGRKPSEDDIIIQQWTGLFDKNKNEIFEGDILKVKMSDDHPPSICSIRFLEDAGCYSFFNPKQKYQRCDIYYLADKNNSYKIPQDRLEVIGNIFEDLNLLSNFEPRKK